MGLPAPPPLDEVELPPLDEDELPPLDEVELPPLDEDELPPLDEEPAPLDPLPELLVDVSHVGSTSVEFGALELPQPVVMAQSAPTKMAPAFEIVLLFMDTPNPFEARLTVYRMIEKANVGTRFIAPVATVFNRICSQFAPHCRTRVDLVRGAVRTPMSKPSVSKRVRA